MRVYIFIIILMIGHLSAGAQFAPQAGVTGSTAISSNDSRIVGWANGCTIQFGWKDIADKTKGKTSYGDSTAAIGKADNGIVSLGDSGIAVLTFPNTIYNGPGPDFLVFENGFANPSDPEEAFLELAFVEVSSDGVNFTRFPATCLVDTPQIPVAGVYTNARKINNLAGKYTLYNGTPFDLDDLASVSGLDIDRITHVRIVDVIGSVGAHASLDKDGRAVNDPYPTNIPTGGFDLDAVGVLYMAGYFPTNITGVENDELRVYPNPANDRVYIDMPSVGGAYFITITNSVGTVVNHLTTMDAKTQLDISSMQSGIYFVTIADKAGNKWVEKLTKI